MTIEYAINENVAEQTTTLNERNYKDINIINTSSTGETYENESSPFITLKNLRLKNLDKIIIGHLNINSIRHKINLLQPMTEDNIDILVISETKIDKSFPENQFSIDGYNLPYRLDRNQDGGGLLVYFRTGIPSRKLKTNLPENVEGIFFDMNIRYKKWLIKSRLLCYYLVMIPMIVIVLDVLPISYSRLHIFLLYIKQNREICSQVASEVATKYRIVGF